MNILLLNWGDRKNPFGGGAEIHLEEIFSRIAKKGHNVTLLCSKFNNLPEEEIIDGIKIIRIGKRSTFNYDVRRYYINKLRFNKYDIVVDDINKIPFYSPLWVKSPVLPVVPHLFGTTVFKEVSFPLASYVYLFEKPLVKVYDNMLIEVISDSTKDDLIERGFQEENIRVVLCGIDHSIYCPEGDKNMTPLVVFVGRLKKYKGVNIAIDAVRIILDKIPNLMFVVVGSGDACDSFKKYARKVLPEKNFKFTGFISEKEKINWLRKAHVVVNPSEKEGWGLTGVEANACGSVVVASDSPGIRDSIVNNITGKLVPHGDYKTMATEIYRYISDEDLRVRIEKNAISRARKLTWEKASYQTYKIIKEVLA